MAESETIDVQIVILPDREMQRRAIFLSEGVAQRFETYFTLDRHSHLPHITLYQGGFPAKAMESIILSLEEIALTARSFSIPLNSISTFSCSLFYDVGDRWKPRPSGRRSLPEHPKHERSAKPRPLGRGAHRAFDVEKVEGLIQLHEGVVHKLNPLREGILTEECREFLSNNILDAREYKNMLAYGNPLVLDLYRPHITLTKLARSEDEHIAIDYLKNEIGACSFIAESMVLTKPGPYRTCTGVIREFPFALRRILYKE